MIKEKRAPSDRKVDQKMSAYGKILDSPELTQNVKRGNSLAKNKGNVSDDTFLQAASDGDIQIVREFIATGGDINIRSEEQETALMLATSASHVDVVSLLLTNKAKPDLKNTSGDTALHFACSNEDCSIVKLLIAVGANSNIKNDSGNFPLIVAADQSNLEIASLLLSSADIDVNQRNAERETALSCAVENDHGDLVQQLLKKGASPYIKDSRGYSLLAGIFEDGSPALKKIFKAHGFSDGVQNENRTCQEKDDTTSGALDIEEFMSKIEADDLEFVKQNIARMKNINEKDMFGNTSLAIAAEHGFLKIAEEIGKRKPDTEIKNDEGNSPIYLASLGGYHGIVELLIKIGANVNSSNQSNTPLMAAAEGGFVNVCELLIGAGATLDKQNRESQTALMIAAANDHELAVTLLLHHGADKRITDNAGEAACDKTFDNRIRALLKDTSKSEELENTSPPVKLTAVEIRIQLTKSMTGMVGLDSIIKHFSVDLEDFLLSSKSRMRCFWGTQGTGKTEVAQRISGLTDEIPGLNLPDLGVKYVKISDCSSLQVANTVEKRLLVLFDLPDEFFDTDAANGPSPELMDFRHALKTNYSLKPVYFVFLRTVPSLDNSALQLTNGLTAIFGNALGGSIDFSDWRFPGWTLETLMKAVGHVCTRRGLEYDDDALALLCHYCMETGGFVRAFDKIDQTFFRRHKTRHIITEHAERVSRADVEELLNITGIKKAG
ncbi:ankyrin repeat domain-containing protein [Bdellovibrionota bacterium FG-1]